jgi:hypothetical protein
MSHRCARATATFATASLIAVPAMPALGQDVSAVAIHAGRLDPAMTVWCIDHPRQLLRSAQAQGLPAQANDAEKMIRFGHQHDLGPLEWARATSQPEERDFDATCEAAFVAFSHSGVDLTLANVSAAEADKAVHHMTDDEELIPGVHNDALLGIGATLLGVGLTAGIGAGATRRRTRRAEADDLRSLASALRDDLSSWISSQSGPDSVKAQTSANRLASALAVWRKSRESDVREALRTLDELLDAGGGPPYIGNLGDSKDFEKNSKILTDRAEAIHVRTENVAKYVERVVQRDDPQLGPGSGDDDASAGKTG